jgi:hypothetical protein
MRNYRDGILRASMKLLCGQPGTRKLFASANGNAYDSDLGSSGLMLVPNTNYALGGGKQGILYLADATGSGDLTPPATKSIRNFKQSTVKGPVISRHTLVFQQPGERLYNRCLVRE